MPLSIGIKRHSLQLDQWRSLARQCLDFLLPQHCSLCRVPCTDLLCEHCQDQLPFLNHCCRVCALPLGAPGICAECLQSPPEFKRALCALRYETLAAQLILQFKDRQQLQFGTFMTQLLAHTLAQQDAPQVDAITAVPQHWRRSLQRGFNPAHYIAQQLSSHFKLPYSPLFVRAQHSPAQKSLDRKTRLKNLKGVFQLRKDKVPQRVAIVDDVITTGATVRTLAQALRAAGVEEVQVWALARTAKHR